MMSQYQYFPTRLSHLFRHCSVGSIVRTPDYLLTVEDIRHWTNKDGDVVAKKLLYVDQVRSALCINQDLRVPPIAQQIEGERIEGTCIPAVRFPSWMRCPSCGLLYFKPWKGCRTNEKPACASSVCQNKPLLEQVNWVFIHQDGHLDDIPWHKHAHRSPVTPKQKGCRSDPENTYLKLTEEKGTWNVYCGR